MVDSGTMWLGKKCVLESLLISPSEMTSKILPEVANASLGLLDFFGNVVLPDVYSV